MLNGEIPIVPRGDQRALDTAPLEPLTMVQLGGREGGRERNGVGWGLKAERGRELELLG